VEIVMKPFAQALVRPVAEPLGLLSRVSGGSAPFSPLDGITSVGAYSTRRLYTAYEGKRPHRRRTLKPDDEQRCIAAMQEALSA
jgi:hypothetical protein